MKAFGTNNEVLETTPESFDGLDFAIFSAGGDNSVKFAHEAVKEDAW